MPSTCAIGNIGIACCGCGAVNDSERLGIFLTFFFGGCFGVALELDEPRALFFVAGVVVALAEVETVTASTVPDGGLMILLSTGDSRELTNVQ